MKKSFYAMLAAASMVVSSTAAVAQAPVAQAPVTTPLTQPASENVAGDNQFFALSGLAVIFGIGVAASFIAVIVFAIKSGDNGDQPPRTSP